MKPTRSSGSFLQELDAVVAECRKSIAEAVRDYEHQVEDALEELKEGIRRSRPN
jgi:hypothetical protein